MFFPFFVPPFLKLSECEEILLFIPCHGNLYYTDPILVFFGTEIAYAPKQFFSALLRGFSGPKRMIFHFQPVRQKSCQIKPKLFQYTIKL